MIRWNSAFAQGIFVGEKGYASGKGSAFSQHSLQAPDVLPPAAGPDVDAVRLVAEGIRTYQQETGGALLIITHSTRILDPLRIDRTHIMVDGTLVYEGDASLLTRVNESGYDEFIAMKKA